MRGGLLVLEEIFVSNNAPKDALSGGVPPTFWGRGGGNSKKKTKEERGKTDRMAGGVGGKKEIRAKEKTPNSPRERLKRKNKKRGGTLPPERGRQPGEENNPVTRGGKKKKNVYTLGKKQASADEEKEVFPWDEEDVTQRGEREAQKQHKGRRKHTNIKGRGGLG